MAAEGPQQRAGVGPKAGGLIAAGGQKRLAVARPCDVGDFVVMSAKIAAEFASCGLPNLDHAFADGQGQCQRRAVGADGHRVDAVAEGPRAQQVAACGVPNEEAAVVHAGEDQAAVGGEGQRERPRVVEPADNAAVGRHRGA